MKTRKETVELAIVLAQRTRSTNAYTIGKDCLKLCRIGTAASNLAVALCNGAVEQLAFDRKKARLLKQLEPLARAYECRFEIGGDPRGYVLRMHGENLKGNTWGGDEEGYGI